VADIREGGSIRHARESADRARALRDDCLRLFPALAAPAIPLLDRIAKAWLKRSSSPYVHEIDAIARTLGFAGVWFLNGSYQWGCTAIAREEEGAPWIARTLDWPFPGLGRHVEVVHAGGAAGDYYSVTWPGYVGVLTGMAPGRFSASINQAPLWRRTRRSWLRFYDIAANALVTWRLRHMPPDQLLRRVFESCQSFAEARQMLETVPVARPVIFTLAGCRPGERCIIERVENGFTTHSEHTAVANDWIERNEPWEARVGGRRVFSCSYDEANERSSKRRDALMQFGGSFSRAFFEWIVEPVLNPCTRIGVEMSAATGRLRVAGYEIEDGLELPQRVTEVCEIRV
jgi:hypothetical protein